MFTYVSGSTKTTTKLGWQGLSSHSSMSVGANNRKKENVHNFNWAFLPPPKEKKRCNGSIVKSVSIAIDLFLPINLWGHGERKTWWGEQQTDGVALRGVTYPSRQIKNQQMPRSSYLKHLLFQPGGCVFFSLCKFVFCVSVGEQFEHNGLK